MISLASLRRPLAAILLALPLLAACSGDGEEEYVERPVEDLYNQAMDLLRAEEYGAAVTAFEEVERQHPYSTWATKAQLMAGFSAYQDRAYDDAVVSLDRFIQLHPGNPDIAYAYYLKALCFYEQISDVGRDQKMTSLALSSLNEVVGRFPDSKYARDARLKIDLANDHLAGKQMSIGRWYLRQDQYLAAINRFITVIRDYETTTHVPEALYRLSEAYTALGLEQEALRAAAVLGHNFPGDPWYQDAYRLVGEGKLAPPDDESWMSWDLGLSSLFDDD
ncbi:outer membrane protein assembly factor BamD [Roseospirillum parvum]|nr:outer membrane protein assembly factor BamD [Roseospirillum parvum]